MNYKAGDKIVLRKDLTIGEIYRAACCVSDMLDFTNSAGTIRTVKEDGIFSIQEGDDSRHYTTEMIDKQATELHQDFCTLSELSWSDGTLYKIYKSNLEIQPIWMVYNGALYRLNECGNGYDWGNSITEYYSLIELMQLEFIQITKE